MLPSGSHVALTYSSSHLPAPIVPTRIAASPSHEGHGTEGTRSLWGIDFDECVDPSRIDPEIFNFFDTPASKACDSRDILKADGVSHIDDENIRKITPPDEASHGAPECVGNPPRQLETRKNGLGQTTETHSAASTGTTSTSASKGTPSQFSIRLTSRGSDHSLIEIALPTEEATYITHHAPGLVGNLARLSESRINNINHTTGIHNVALAETKSSSLADNAQPRPAIEQLTFCGSDHSLPEIAPLPGRKTNNDHHAHGLVGDLARPSESHRDDTDQTTETHRAALTGSLAGDAQSWPSIQDFAFNYYDPPSRYPFTSRSNFPEVGGGSQHMHALEPPTDRWMEGPVAGPSTIQMAAVESAPTAPWRKLKRARSASPGPSDYTRENKRSRAEHDAVDAVDAENGEQEQEEDPLVKFHIIVGRTVCDWHSVGSTGPCGTVCTTIEAVKAHIAAHKAEAPRLPNGKIQCLWRECMKGISVDAFGKHVESGKHFRIEHECLSCGKHISRGDSLKRHQKDACRRRDSQARPGDL